MRTVWTAEIENLAGLLREQVGLEITPNAKRYRGSAGQGRLGAYRRQYRRQAAQDGTHGVRRQPRIANSSRKLRQIFIALIVAANNPFAEFLVPPDLYVNGDRGADRGIDRRIGVVLEPAQDRSDRTPRIGHNLWLLPPA